MIFIQRCVFGTFPALNKWHTLRTKPPWCFDLHSWCVSVTTEALTTTWHMTEQVGFMLSVYSTALDTGARFSVSKCCKLDVVLLGGQMRLIWISREHLTGTKETLADYCDLTRIIVTWLITPRGATAQVHEVFTQQWHSNVGRKSQLKRPSRICKWREMVTSGLFV